MSKSDASAPTGAAYRSGLTRRQTLKWLSTLSATMAVPAITGCESIAISTAKFAGGWPDLKLEPITGEGYGKDPDLISPPGSPWPLTLTADQRNLVAVLCDILIPREGDTPSASEVKVPDVIDEWVSAPYPSNQSDRLEILPALAWIDQESRERFGRKFVDASVPQRLEIIDDIAYEEAEKSLRYVYIAKVFDGLRSLITIAFFASPEGTRDLGYIGNTAIAGDYPGPTPEAMEHLGKVLEELGLSEYAYS
jgi:Gluconate 2-dehydrogenase subunit 3